LSRWREAAGAAPGVQWGEEVGPPLGGGGSAGRLAGAPGPRGSHERKAARPAAADRASVMVSTILLGPVAVPARKIPGTADSLE